MLGRAACLIVAAFRRYTFPDNCYSETIAGHPDIMASMAKAHGMIGKAEPLLYVPTLPRLRSLRVDGGLSQVFRPTESCCVWSGTRRSA